MPKLGFQISYSTDASKRVTHLRCRLQHIAMLGKFAFFYIVKVNRRHVDGKDIERDIFPLALYCWLIWLVGGGNLINVLLSVLAKLYKIVIEFHFGDLTIMSELFYKNTNHSGTTEP